DGLGEPLIARITDPALIPRPFDPGDQCQCLPATKCWSDASMIAVIPLCFSVITGTRTTPGRSGSAYGSYSRSNWSFSRRSTSTGYTRHGFPVGDVPEHPAGSLPLRSHSAHVMGLMRRNAHALCR